MNLTKFSFGKFTKKESTITTLIGLAIFAACAFMPFSYTINDIIITNEDILKASMILFGCIIVIILIKKGQTINKLKKGQIPSQEIKGTIKNIEITRTGKGSYLSGRYFIAEGPDGRTYESDEYTLDIPTTLSSRSGPSDEDARESVKKYVHMGDQVKIHVSVEDNDDYYIEANYPETIAVEKDTGRNTLEGKIEKVGFSLAENYASIIGIVLLLPMAAVLGFFGYLSLTDPEEEDKMPAYVCFGIVLFILGIIALLIKNMIKNFKNTKSKTQ